MKAVKKKDEGFTLVEVLAAVTILGILSVVAMVAINGIIQNAKEEHYVTAEDQLKLAGQSYVQQNRSSLPKAIGQKTKIPLKTLVENNYIKQIKDYSDNNCDLNKSYVQIFKYSTSDYSYVAYLDCPAYNSKETITKGSPTIILTMSDPNKTNKSSASIKISDNEKLLSWSYIIYKDGKEVKNSGSNYLKDYPKTLNETISLAKYTPGKVKVVVSATNIYGLTTTKSSGTINYKDTQGPTCIIKEVDKKTNPKSWTKGPVTVTVGCDDGDGVGCTKAEFTKTFKTTTDVGKITIEDKEGNKTTCEVSVNVDVTPPSVPTVKMYKWKNNNTRPTSESGLSSYTANSWSGQNIFTIASGSTDKESGLAKYQYTIEDDAPAATNKDGTSVSIETTGTSKIKYRACDKLGNCSAYSSAVTIKVDKIAPTCTSSGGSATWTNGNRTLTGTCSDSHSGCAGNATKTFSSDINSSTESPGTVKDKVGNATVCPGNQTVKIDKTPPTVPTGGNIGAVSGSSTTGTIQTAATGSTDTGSGVKEYRYLVNTTGTTPGNTNASFTTSKTFTRTCGTTYYAYAIAVDNAGNKSAVKSLGQTSDGANKYSSWSSCTAKCNGGTQTRTNSCALITTGLSQSCNEQDCCSSTTTTWGSYGACNKSCGGGTQTRSGTKYSTYDGRNCGTTTSSQACNKQDCCSSTVISSYSGWSSCSKTCGGGKQYKTAYLVSAYDSSVSCGSKANALEQSCNTQSCCSDSNPTGCTWVTACREGNTFIYTSSSASTYAGTVQHHLNGANDRLYVLGSSGGMTKVYAASGNFYSAAPSNRIVWIHTNCIGGSNSVCPYAQCQG